MAVDAASLNIRGANLAQEKETKPADTGTSGATSATPVWDSFNGEMYPFLSLNEEKKRAGFRVQFLTNKPRKETVNKFNEQETDFWFDVIHDGVCCTWTFGQKSLLMELQKHKPLKNKVFDIKLAPVDENFMKQFPKYKGKDRYEVIYVETKEPDTETAETESDSQDAISVEDL